MYGGEGVRMIEGGKEIATGPTVYIQYIIYSNSMADWKLPWRSDVCRPNHKSREQMDCQHDGRRFRSIMQAVYAVCSVSAGRQAGRQHTSQSLYLQVPPGESTLILLTFIRKLAHYCKIFCSSCICSNPTDLLCAIHGKMASLGSIDAYSNMTYIGELTVCRAFWRFTYTELVHATTSYFSLFSRAKIIKVSLSLCPHKAEGNFKDCLIASL